MTRTDSMQTKETNNNNNKKNSFSTNNQTEYEGKNNNETTVKNSDKNSRLENVEIVSELYEMDFYVSLTLCFISHSSVRFSRVLILSIFVFVSFSSQPTEFVSVYSFVCLFFRFLLFNAIVFPCYIRLRFGCLLTFNCYFTGEYEQRNNQKKNIHEYALIMGISADDDAQLKLEKAENRIDFILAFRSKYGFNT